MRRVVTSVAILVAALLVIVITQRVASPVELLVALLVLIIAGVFPFALGVVVQMLTKAHAVPICFAWSFGVVAGAVRLIVPQFGGLTVFESEAAAVVFTVLLSASFMELGSAAVRTLRQGRADSNEPSALRGVR